MRGALLLLALLGGACYAKGSYNRRVGAACTSKDDCESVCWEGSCTVACQTAADCPSKPSPMTCVDAGVCAFTCVRQRDCGAWMCTHERRRESDEKVWACLPSFSTGNPEDVDPNPPGTDETGSTMNPP